MMTIQQFASCIGCTLLTADVWHPPFEAAMLEFGIDSESRAAAFLAQAGHESGSLAHVVESLSYSAQRLLQVWPSRFPTLQSTTGCAYNAEHLACVVYANRMGNGDVESGDGWKYRGRGPIQITGADNYERCGEALALPLLEQPELLEGATAGARSAAWFFVHAGCVQAADAGDIDWVSDLVNLGRHTDKQGDAPGFADRLARYQRCLQVLEVQA